MRSITAPALAGAIPDDYPTIDHLDERFSEWRGKFAGIERTVLACRACNSKRSNDNLSLDERRQLSGAWPIGHPKRS